MDKQHIEWLMDDSRRELRSARTHLSDGTYPKCINDSYYAVFYAAKAGLGWLGIRTKGHQSVQIGVETAISQQDLPTDLRGILAELLRSRNIAVYHYARRDWTAVDASDALSKAEAFVETIEGFLSS